MASNEATSGGPSVEMPRYKCHKEVWALKIGAIRPVMGTERHSVDEIEKALNREEEVQILVDGTILGIGGVELVPSDDGYGPICVSADYVRRHKPQVGGYLVVYKDGYQSFSPAEAFEEGYRAVRRSTRHELFKRRLRELGMYDKDSDYDGALGKAVEELSEVFASQGHSGASARVTVELFNKLMDEYQD